MEHHFSFLFQFFLFIFLTYFTSINSVKIPRLSSIPTWDTSLHHPATLDAKTSTDKINTFYYKQVLDHFNYRPQSYRTFQQRYLINFKYWGGANSSAPILAFFGAEEAIDHSPEGIAFLTDNAASLNALLVYIEHRYYGKSIPFGSREEAFKNASTIGYFNSAQAIADYAAVLIHVKKTLHAPNSPVIVIGGSYGGMLASWFRLKYPHMAIGALASSAPILYFDDITPQDGYYSVVSRDFREASETCYQTILKSWSEIDRVASQPKGLPLLSQRFNTCRPLKKSSELKDYLETMYASAAQYNHPPRYPVTVICGGIDKGSFGNDILSKIYAGVVALRGNTTCKVNAPSNESETALGWRWQTCSEMVIPVGIGKNSMFQPQPYSFKSLADECKKLYGVSPRPHWVTTYYGGHNIKLILQKFGSNIIFSNGLRDPYSIGGVLENISDTLVAIHAVNGSHCLDILGANANHGDPKWLVEMRKKEINIMKGWITQYYVDLQALKETKKM
ncbi:lysosomal Pro-X carboxypeptidase-like isoform X2 [Vigna unguiculata]|uniref:lysosomal Pro-X carboxypeptidase-like isoform X2 n=1 Tax=Vigna unguiculata TaxID=3917 RepID=UPI001016679B|nr:lysosomal Pro-X carboxypeptidase-like isoform X2 [Vigna unguiculata]